MEQTQEAQAFQSIENYGVIGNMRSIALVCWTGSIDFLCLPGFDSPSIFAALLDTQRGGHFRITPDLHNVRYRQLYLPNTNILLTRFLSEDGVAEITDFMPIVENGDHQKFGHHILRQIRVVKGEVQFRMECAPRFNYARTGHKASVEGQTIIFVPEIMDFPKLALHATIPVQISGGDAVATFTLKAGETATVAFGQLEEEEDAKATLLNADTIEHHFQQTANFWRNWIERSHYKGRWREMVNRSALTLKMLCSADYGSLIAAPTFGLPEEIGGERNWDYRYTWLRDASFSMYAFIRLGFMEETRAFTHWIRERIREDARHGPLQLMYHPDGSQKLDEIELNSLHGYRDSRPVRIGNAAFKQLQLDIYGELMDAIYLANKYGDGISYDGWQNVLRILDWLAKNWKRADEGIWEVRGGRKEFLHSRLMCWVAFDRAVRLAEKRSLAGPIEKWREIRDSIHKDIYRNFWSDDLQSFVQYRGSQSLDASVLLMPLMRFISPIDRRWLSTLDAIKRNLVEDTLVYRYDNSAAPVDGLRGKEGSFTACSFWYIECLARAHQAERAQLLFDKMLGYANHLGLYSEQLGSAGEHLGNFPQAFTHLALISAATALDREIDGGNHSPWK